MTDEAMVFLYGQFDSLPICQVEDYSSLIFIVKFTTFNPLY